MHRPDNREPAIVWHWFEKAFEDQNFPNVSGILGSDWGWGRIPVLSVSAAQYKAKAYSLMVEFYGPKP